MGAVPDERVQGWVVAGRRTLDRRGDRGASAVEFALVSIPLLTLVFGMISYGYMLSFRQAISQAAAEGARGAAVALPSTPDKQVSAAVAHVNNTLSSYGMTCGVTAPASGAVLPVTRTGDITKGSRVGSCSVVLKTCTNDSTKTCVTVTVDHEYRAHPLTPAFPGLGLVLPDHLRYSSVAVVS